MHFRFIQYGYCDSDDIDGDDSACDSSSDTTPQSPGAPKIKKTSSSQPTSSKPPALVAQLMLRDMARIAEHANMVAKLPAATEKGVEQIEKPESKVNVVVKSPQTVVEAVATEVESGETEGKNGSENLSLQYQEMFKRLVQVIAKDSAVVATTGAPKQQTDIQSSSVKEKEDAHVAQAQVMPPVEPVEHAAKDESLVNGAASSSMLEESVMRKPRKGTPIKLETNPAPVKKQDEVTDLSVKQNLRDNLDDSESKVAKNQSAAQRVVHPAKAHTQSRDPRVAPSGVAPLDLSTPKGCKVGGENCASSPPSYEEPEDMSLNSHAHSPVPPVDDGRTTIKSQTLLLNGKKYEIVPLGDGRWISQNEYELLRGLGEISGSSSSSSSEKCTKDSNQSGHEMVSKTFAQQKSASKRQLVGSNCNEPCAKRQCKPVDALGDKTAINMTKSHPDKNGNEMSDQNGNQPMSNVVTSCGSDLDSRHLIDKEMQKYTCLTQLLKPQQ